MKNLKKLYDAIENVEENTLFKLEYIDVDNELHFVYFKDEYKMILSSNHIFLANEDCDILIDYDEMVVLMQLMQILKEFN